MGVRRALHPGGPPIRILERSGRASVTVQRDGRALSHQPTFGRTGRDETEQRAVERVDPGRREADPPEPEREDRVLAVARVVMGRARGGQDRQVGLAPESVVQGGEQVVDRLVIAPGVLEPACTDLRVGTAVDAARLKVGAAQRRACRAGRRCG